MKTKSLIIAALFSATVGAESISVERGLLTKHIDYSSWMNEDSNFTAAEVRFNKQGANISKFSNTYGNDTVTIGGFYNIYDSKYAEVDLMYGVVNGYTSDQLDSPCSGDNCLYAAPRITIKRSIINNVDGKVSVQLFGTAVVVTAGLRCNF